MINKYIQPKKWALSKRITFMMMALCIGSIPTLQTQNVSAAACSVPSTDYGQAVELNVSASTTATYRIWTRMSAPDTANNTYLLEVDGVHCFSVGGAGVPTYGVNATTYFTDSTSNWISKTATGTPVTVTLNAGTHTMKLIGNAPGVVVDRLILTASTSCVPTGTGDNCTDASAPVVSNMKSTSVTQNSATISWVTNEPSSTRVEYGTSTAYGSLSTLLPQMVTNHSTSLSSLAPGTQYHYRVISIDEAGNSISSGDSTFTTASVPAYASADINQDGVIGILDVSLLATKWSQTGAGVGRSDINGDGVVNALDLSLLIANYGK